jgi:phage baseplate assembly protein W
VDLDVESGAAIEGWAEVVQSIRTILSTRTTTRVFRRDFGSDLPTLIDAPMNDAGVLAAYVAIAEALEAWEPRFEVTDMRLTVAPSGVLDLTLEGVHRPRAHLGDLATAADETRAIRVQRDRVDSWRLAA